MDIGWRVGMQVGEDTLNLEGLRNLCTLHLQGLKSLLVMYGASSLNAWRYVDM